MIVQVTYPIITDSGIAPAGSLVELADDVAAQHIARGNACMPGAHPAATTVAATLPAPEPTESDVDEGGFEPVIEDDLDPEASRVIAALPDPEVVRPSRRRR